MGKSVEQMRQAQEIMKPFQRLPILGEEVFVVIPVALLDLDTERL